MLRKTDLGKMSKLAENISRQKSRQSWLKLGDRKKKIQIIASNRFQTNLIGAIKAEGRMLEERDQIKTAVVRYFIDVFMEEKRIRTNLGGLFPRILPMEKSMGLERVFEEKEIWLQSKIAAASRHQDLMDSIFLSLGKLGSS